MPIRKVTDLSTIDAAQRLLRVFFNIAREWRLNPGEQQVLLGVSNDVFTSWRDAQVTSPLNDDTLVRLRHIVSIYAWLQMLVPVPERANAWLRRPNSAPLFGGEAALERMLDGNGEGLRSVAEYVQAARAADFS